MAAGDDYLTPEARARVRIDEMLTTAGWVVQDYRRVDRSAGRGVAVREFPLAGGHGAGQNHEHSSSARNDSDHRSTHR